MFAFSSPAYIQVHFRLDLFMEATNMNPDQTAPKESSLIWVHFVCFIRLPKNISRRGEHDWWAKV